MVAMKIRSPEEVKRGEWLIARCDLIVMDSVQYNEVDDTKILKSVVDEYRSKLAVLDRDADSYRDEVAADPTLHEVRRKIKDIAEIVKAFETRVEKLNLNSSSTTTRKWCARHSKYDCPHPDVEPVSTPFHAAPLAKDRSPMDVKLGEHVDMSERFPEFGCGDCPHAKDCFQRSVCFEAIKEMVPEDTDSEELKQLIEAAFVVTASEPAPKKECEPGACLHASVIPNWCSVWNGCMNVIEGKSDRVRGSEDDLTPAFDHCTICWERIPYGESYCNECYDAMGEVRAEAEGPDESVPAAYPDVDSWADAF